MTTTKKKKKKKKKKWRMLQPRNDILEKEKYF